MIERFSVPSLTIVTAVKNARGTIGDCIASVNGQTHVRVQHIIVDGGSTDGTLEIARRDSAAGAILVTEEDSGIYDAMNKGIKLATADIIGILNADDVYANSGVLAKVAQTFRNEAVESCYGDLVYVDSRNTEKIVRFWKSGSFNAERFYWGWMPPHPTFFVDRKVYEKYGVFDLAFGSAADYELMLRLLLKYRISTFYVPETLVKMRAGGVSNASLRNRMKANAMDRLAWEANHLHPYRWTVWMKPLRKLHQYVLPWFSTT